MNEFIARVPIKKLCEYWNPLLAPVWGWGAGGEAEDKYELSMNVAECLYWRKYMTTPVPAGAPLDHHAQRIAYFIEHGWDDPIHIDIGIPGHSDFEIAVEDGNHRLAAAIKNGHATILARFSGSIDEIERLFDLDDGPRPGWRNW